MTVAPEEAEEPEDVEREAERVRRLLRRAECWIEAPGQGRFSLRTSADRRRRAALKFGAATFERLAADPGLEPRAEGGWTARARAAGPSTPSSGPKTGPETGPEPPSPFARLARHDDAEGRPWLSSLQAKAGARLWSDLRRGPARAAGAAALASLDPASRAMLEQVCRNGGDLAAAEAALGLPPQTGRTALKLALLRLARHYGLRG